MVSVKILVTYKNKHKVLKSDIITPIQTGRAIADEIFEEYCCNYIVNTFK